MEPSLTGLKANYSIYCANMVLGPVSPYAVAAQDWPVCMQVADSKELSYVWMKE